MNPETAEEARWKREVPPGMEPCPVFFFNATGVRGDSASQNDGALFISRASKKRAALRPP